MPNWLRSFFAWKTVRDTGVHLYQANTVTGRRRVVRTGAPGWQPVDQKWVETGEWRQPRPPTGPSCIPVFPNGGRT